MCNDWRICVTVSYAFTHFNSCLQLRCPVIAEPAYATVPIPGHFCRSECVEVRPIH